MRFPRQVVPIPDYPKVCEVIDCGELADHRFDFTFHWQLSPVPEVPSYAKPVIVSKLAQAFLCEAHYTEVMALQEPSNR